MRDAIVTQVPVGVTQDHWVYRCYDAGDELLYVGVTGRGLRRLAHEHAKRAEWAAHVACIEVEHYATLEAAFMRERALIVERHPRFNLQHADGALTAIPEGAMPTHWLSIDDLADWLDAEVAWIGAKMEQGMPHAYIADDLRFKAAEVVDWLKDRRRRRRA